MAYVMSIRVQTSGGSGSTIGSAIETFVLESEFSSGEALVLSPPVGATILSGDILVNYMQKPLQRSTDDLDLDYSFVPDTITLLFGDDPTQYANGQIIIQISYDYTT